MKYLRYILLLLPAMAKAQSCAAPFTDTFAGSSGTTISMCYSQTLPSTAGMVVNGSNAAVLANPVTDSSYEMMTGAVLVSGKIEATLTWTGTLTGIPRLLMAGDTSGNYYNYNLIEGSVTQWTGGSFSSTFISGCPTPFDSTDPIASGDVISLEQDSSNNWTCKDETTGKHVTQNQPFPGPPGKAGMALVESNGAWSNLQITGTTVPVAVTTTSLCAGEVGTAYSCSATAEGGTSRYTWTLTGTAFPSPLILDPTTCTSSTVPCQITGTPTSTSTTTGIILTATDSSGDSANSSSLSITIYPTPPPPGPGVPGDPLCKVSAVNGTTPPCDTNGSTMNIVVAEADSSCGPQVPAPFTESNGNVYTRVACAPAPGATGTGLWASSNPITAINTTWTTNSIIVVQTYPYIASGPDQTNSSLSGTDTGLITPIENNELIFSYAAAQRAGSTPTSSPATLLGSATDGFITQAAAAETQTTGPSPVSNSFAWGGDNGQVQAIASFFSTMNPGPLTITPHLVEEVAGAPCLSTLAAAGGLTPYTFTLDPSSPALPTGVTLNPDGTFTCSGTVAGVTTGLIFRVTDSQGTPAHTLSSAATLPIASAALSASFSGSTSGVQLTAYAGGTVTISGGYPSYAATNTALPEGMSIACTGSSCSIASSVIRGQGDYTSTVKVTDMYGATASTIVNFSIAGNNSFNGHLLFQPDSIWRAKLKDLPEVTGGFAGIFSSYASSSLRILFGNGGEGGMRINTVPFGSTPSIPDGTSNMFTDTSVPCDAAVENGPIDPSTFDGGVDHHNVTVFLDAGGNPDYEIDGYQTYCQKNGTGWTNVGSGGQDVSFSPQPPSPPSIVTSYLMIQPDLGWVADAAGEPLAASILKFDDVKGSCSGDYIRDGSGNIIDIDVCGSVPYPIRFTLEKTLFYALPPATGAAGNGANSCSGGGTDNGNAFMTFLSPPVTCAGITVATAPPGTFLNPLGETFGLPASFAEPTACKPPSMGGTGNNETHILFQSMSEETGAGIINADAGLSMAIIGTDDSRWLPDDLVSPCFSAIHGYDFVGYVTETLLKTPWLGSQENSTQTTSSAVINNVQTFGNVNMPGDVVLY